MCLKGWKVMILTGRLLQIEELVIHVPVLHVQHSLQFLLCHAHPSATG